jgi:hypothetical protein
VCVGCRQGAGPVVVAPHLLNQPTQYSTLDTIPGGGVYVVPRTPQFARGRIRARFPALFPPR